MKGIYVLLMLNLIIILSFAIWWTEYTTLEKVFVNISGILSLVLFIFIERGETR